MPKIEEAKYIWMSGRFVPWNEAKVHVLVHALHYGSAVFEGIRAYKTKRGTAVFRLREHLKRLLDSAKIYRMESPYTLEELLDVTLELIKKNKLEECYIRPLLYRGYHSLGVNPFECPVEVSIAAWRWGKYLGPEALEKGVDVMVSSWNRMAPNTFPAMAKATANYANSQLIKMEAVIYGFTEGIALNHVGAVSEGSGENLFLIKDGIIYTPSLDAAVLPGITRNTIIEIARKMGYEVKETHIPREMLYIADELFFTGTAAEVTPIRSVDKIVIGNGKRGPITKKLQDEFFRIIREADPEYENWFTFVK
ncbi:MAG TPA: branched-chain amino acid transaminase [candidate division WOR-3 bacterium]|uniref:Branched-chain-amino-acid aminotransferase n=1 Tax=candidate division WOR-3 bacterium TaxID=2052148 RepID=A0A7V5HN97_UNCW3|nr:branched-chain amino acid transaminase [candidate division WOR-3 bacterium]